MREKPAVFVLVDFGVFVAFFYFRGGNRGPGDRIPLPVSNFQNAVLPLF
jgi:hypothetical protein